ncbi:MAG TPA: radical SAM protein [Leptospiraceae bacterium]|nr:radical SAM protein [Leptospiraceae bacterium]
MILSKHTFLADRINSDDALILNYLSGSIDKIEKKELEELKNRISLNDWDNYHLGDYMLERGYLYSNKEVEEDKINEKYLEFMEEYEKTATQLIFSTSYICNFSCVYCFQEEYNQNSKTLNNEITDKFFNYIDKKFSNEPGGVYITLFGGEPLLGGEKHKNHIMYFLSRAVKSNIPVAIVTNGYELKNYIHDFKSLGANIKEIQVTVDGDRENHNSRRFTRSKETTFDTIMEGVDLALKNGYRINLRSILDKRNIASLVKLAEYCEEKGFLDYPSSHFETSIGRNYELHSCQDTKQLFSRYDMWLEYFKLSEEFPILKKYHKPGFHGMRMLAESGELPVPIFDSCPACKKEWAFDANGGIYSCTATVGVSKYQLGNYFEKDTPLNQEKVLEWQTRDVLTMEECKDCSVSLSCGGGCATIAANENNGKIHSTNCRPVKELVGIGLEYYKIGE